MNILMSGVRRWLKSTVSQSNNLLLTNSKQSLSFGASDPLQTFAFTKQKISKGFFEAFGAIDQDLVFL